MILGNDFGPGYNISYKITYAPSEDSDQPRTLVRVFAVRLKKLKSLATSNVPCEDLSDCAGALDDLSSRSAHI